MTYQELKHLCKGNTFPLCAKNADGENIIVHHGINNEGNFFDIQTAQNNGWIRHNFVYEDGSAEELYDKRNS